MRRRSLLMSATATLTTPSIGRAAELSVVKVVPQSDLGSIDPIWTPAIITRCHGYLVYDTLYGVTLGLQARPQMAVGEQIEDDGRLVTITLRDGLIFHDGEKVRAIDCVASIRRWMQRNSFGDTLAGLTEELTVLDDRRLRFRLSRPFPLLTRALANPSQPAYIMPERIARTDPFKQIDDATGSGPFRFKRDEFNSGSRVVYESHAGYVPRDTGEPDLTTGPKLAYFKRVEWHVIPDSATAAAALQNGEVDWYEQPLSEHLPLFRNTPALSVETVGPFPAVAVLRFNFLQPPFNDKAIRQAIMPAVQPDDFMIALAGETPGGWQPGGVFTPGTPMATNVGLEPLQGPRSIDSARALLARAGYSNQRMRLIGPTDIRGPAALTQVAADLFQRLDMNVDVALSDWGTVVQRRGSREPVEKGGWSVFLTNLPGFSCVDPSGHTCIRGNGTAPGNFFGWPGIPRLEGLRNAWFAAPDESAQQRLCVEIQRVAMDELPIVPLGAAAEVTALRRDLVGRVRGALLFWGLRRA